MKELAQNIVTHTTSIIDSIDQLDKSVFQQQEINLLASTRGLCRDLCIMMAYQIQEMEKDEDNQAMGTTLNRNEDGD